MKKLLATSVLAATAFAGVSAPVMADVSANIGYASEYYYRGLMQTESSASAGIDFEQGGFYAGTWAADVGDGLEYDLYAGYGIESGDFSASLGVTGYYYTGDFDDTYEEINLNLGYGPISFEYSVGTYDNFGGPEQDYDFAAVTLEQGGFYATYGTFGDDFEGDYVEFGYGTEIGGFDVGVAAIISDEDLVGGTESDEALILTLGKSFDL